MTAARFRQQASTAACGAWLAVAGLSAAGDTTIAELARAHDLGAIRAQLAAGADVNATQPDGATALRRWSLRTMRRKAVDLV